MAFIPSDTRFNLQWHLLNSTPDQYDLNVVDVWDDYTGAGVRVVALDSGFDYTHPDYDNYRTDLDWDFENNDSIALPDPGEDDSHGTPVLGIIGAAQDGEGTVGIAFDADIIGYKTDWSRDQVEAAIELATTAGHDIISMSYGEGNNVFVPRDTLVDAAETAAETGRGGLGLIMVKSSGNSRRDADNIFREETTAEALENSRYTIVVAGVSDAGDLPSIANQLGPDVGANKSSSPGANILTTAFYGRDGRQVQTTDITGSQGYSFSDYTGFTGTSAAAPQVAGVIALILEANPNLGWRDVQDIIAYSSRQIGSEVGALAEGEEQATQQNGSTWFWNGAQNWNGGGLHYSNDYGFGLIDAKAAVRLAETWTTSKTSANEANPTRVDGLDSTVTIGEGSASGGTRSFYLTFASGIDIENITLGVSFDAANLADLEIYLTSPSGTRVQLIADTGDIESWSGYWRFGSTAFRGESSQGTWRVQITDDDSAVTSPITVSDIDLWTHGSTETNDDVFIFTNEFADYAGVDGHSTNIVGGAGTDTINTAAIDDGVILDLQNGVGFLVGHQITMSGIEQVFTGDGNDRIHDGTGANTLRGGRGNDTLRDTSAGGSDRYYGNQGNDTFEVYSAIGGDSFYGGAGRDAIDWSGSNETSATFDLAAGEARDTNGNVEVMTSIADIIGTAQRDTIIESAATNDIDGFDGNDTIIVTTLIGNDSFSGGNGRDTIDWSAVSENGAHFDLAAGTATDSSGNVEVMREFENLIGTENDDIITENTAANTITALGGNDLVYVTSLIGGDSFDGGSGNDTIDWSGSNQANGLYNLIYGVAYFGASQLEVMDSFENFIGTNQADTVVESHVRNVIDTGSGDDIVRVASVIGSDSFTGGFGTDTIDWSGSAQANGVYDLAGGTATNGSQTEIMFGFENFVGTDQADTIIEGSGTNTIISGNGNDTILVNTAIGSDSFNGSAGIDTIDWSGSSQTNGVYDLSGGTATAGGNTETMFSFENFIGTSQADTIIEGSGSNTINAGSGNDTVRVNSVIGSDSFTGGFGTDTIDWSASAQVNGVYDISGGTASADGNTETMFGFENFIGTNQADIIIEGGGNNNINAGGGNDTVRVNTAIGNDSFTGGLGTDIIDWSGSSQINGVYDLAGGTASAGGQTEVMSGFENFTGTNQADTIIEGNGPNNINAGDGDDTVRISSLIGDDITSGGLGNDTIDWSDSAQAGGTYDLLFGLATAGGQNESMSSFENFIGTKQADTIIEGFSTNSIAGGGGDDLVITGATLSVSHDGGNGTDRIDWQNLNVQNVTFDLQAGTASAVRGLPATMTNFENLTGSGFSDTVRGTSLGNDIRGMAGDDTLIGRAGNDVVRGGTGNDQIRGNTGRDMLYGGAGNDNIRGGGGHDFLSDGGGKDRLLGQNGNDIFSFGVDGSVDRIRDFTLGQDQIQLTGFAFGDLTISDMASGNIRVAYGTDSLIIVDSADLLSASDLTSSDFLFA